MGGPLIDGVLRLSIELLTRHQCCRGTARVARKYFAARKKFSSPSDNDLCPNRPHEVSMKVHCSLDVLPRQCNRRSTHDNISATISTSFLTLVIGSLTNRANANRYCFYTTKHSYVRLHGWCAVQHNILPKFSTDVHELRTPSFRHTHLAW